MSTVKINNFEERTFKRNFGLSKQIAKKIYNKVPFNYCLPEKNFLMALDFICNYPTLHTLAQKYNLTERSIRDKIWMSIELISQFIDPPNINWRFLSEETPRCLKPGSGVNDYFLTAVDSTACKYASSDSSYFSFKHKEKVLKYQVLVCTRTGIICNIYGPEKGTVSDITLFRRSLKIPAYKLYQDPNEFIIGDKGYIGESDKILTPFKKYRGQPWTPNHELFNNYLSYHRRIVENTFSRYKKFKSLSVPWRSSPSKHSMVFKIVTYIINCHIMGDRIDKSPPTFIKFRPNEQQEEDEEIDGPPTTTATNATTVATAASVSIDVQQQKQQQHDVSLHSFPNVSLSPQIGSISAVSN
ncbi:hypothetical protein CYY_009867 [Polysphondylium violaceum]|uniref:DDE Tnp4 domain-containing protein n=1 Tax=Polysphondylium violaceum TaxID=133409 RepID=A0A8J4PKZ1_9MYCE|nr:hypothetical protein CYY_009867 [Polysphondylium violaceum]